MGIIRFHGFESTYLGGFFLTSIWSIRKNDGKL